MIRRTIGNDEDRGIVVAFAVGRDSRRDRQICGLTFSTPGPYNSLKVHMILVYVAEPQGQ